MCLPDSKGIASPSRKFQTAARNPSSLFCLRLDVLAHFGRNPPYPPFGGVWFGLRVAFAPAFRVVPTAFARVPCRVLLVRVWVRGCAF